MKKQILAIFLSLFSVFLTHNAFSQAWIQVGAGVNDSVMAMDSARGKLYIGGSFTSPGKGIVAWDGTALIPLGSGISGSVRALTEYNGNLIAAGNFNIAGGITAHNIAMWNGSKWSVLDSGINGTVNTLTIYNTNLVAGGNFNSAGGKPANNIAIWNGTSWATLGPGVTGGINALAQYNDTLYAGGAYSTIGGQTAYLQKWNGTTWDSIPGTSPPRFCSNGCWGVHALAVYNKLLYVGGFYSSNTNGGVWNGSKWNSTTFIGESVIEALSVYRGYLLAGGSGADTYFDTTWQGIAPIYGCLACQPCGGAGVQFIVMAVAGYNGNMYAGGSFLSNTNGWGNNAAPYLMEYTGPLGVNEIKNKNEELKVYPNPSNGIFYIQMDNTQFTMDNEKTQVEVYNVLGEKVYSSALSIVNSSLSIDLSNQPGSIYLYRVIDETGKCIGSGKLIKQ